jgi:hypothetical protein
MTAPMTSEELAAVARRAELFEPYEDQTIGHMICNSIAEDRAALLAHIHNQTPPQAVTREQIAKCLYELWPIRVEVDGPLYSWVEACEHCQSSIADHYRQADAILALFEKPAPTPTPLTLCEDGAAHIFKQVVTGQTTSGVIGLLVTSTICTKCLKSQREVERLSASPTAPPLTLTDDEQNIMAAAGLYAARMKGIIDAPNHINRLFDIIDRLTNTAQENERDST